MNVLSVRCPSPGICCFGVVQMDKQVPLTKLVYVALAIFATVFLVDALKMPPPRDPSDIGSAFLPIILLLLIFVFAGIDFFVSKSMHRTISARDLVLAIVTSAVMFLTIWLGANFGLFLVLPIASFITLWIAGSRRLIANAVFSVVFVGFIWLLFDKLLGMPLHTM